MPEHEPQVGQALRSNSAASSSVTSGSAAWIIASIRSTAISLPLNVTLPASIGPPETKTAGTLSRIAAISKIGRASGRERVCQVRVDLGGRRIIKKQKNN